MKEFKGLYHEEKSYIPCFEHGAHFKYLHLVNALKELQLDLYNRNDLETLEITESPILKNNKILLLNDSNKKYKNNKLKKYLLTENNENIRINNIDNKENEKNEKSYNKYIRESRKELLYNSKIKNHEKGVSRSIDKIKDKLPSILNNNNSIALRNKSYNPQKIIDRIIYNFDEEETTNNNALDIIEYNTRNKNYENNSYESENIKDIQVKKTNKKLDNMDYLPKINIFQQNPNKIKENENKTKKKEINFQDNINDTNISNEAKSKKSRVQQKSHKRLKRLILIENLMNSSENKKSNKIINANNKLKSIFETEKHIRNSKFLLSDKNNSYNRNYCETINDDMAQQIYQIKKQLLINKKSKFSNKQ